MSKRGVKLGVVSVLATGALLTGCNDAGRKWAMTAQEDYYSEQAQDETGRARSHFVSSSSLFETNEQVPGTGGSGEASPGAQLAHPQRTHAQGDQWLRQDFRVPYPPPQYSGLMFMPLGTGNPLRAGPNGAWIQGTYAVELGSGLASGPIRWREPAAGLQAPPQVPTREQGQSSTSGQQGENLTR
ncbi:hypothetical protein JQX13_07010 [Archangium violaceum]|uniref:hypothetical protein n=1 Tax=Archangium violaceum TaxID=83451 RepID=UPI00193B545E|nr:hypothetical protein [Archangium violaceum]QRK09852.1 hypothetical protein JQX13_07010 [Archangium violaceum]